MDVYHILEDLAYDTGELPREALESAISMREEITPHLLQILQKAIERIDEIIEHDSYCGHLFAMYLLAQFREVAAYPLVLKLVAFPSDLPHAIAGDVLTEDLSRILASVFSGDCELLEKVIENPLLNEYVRAACQSALVILVGSKMVERTHVIAYFKTLFHTLQRIPSYVWDNLAICAIDLYPLELKEELRLAIQEGLVDTSFVNEKMISETLANSQEEHLAHLYLRTELIEDTVSEMEKWISCAC